ncbi:unnamed protein product, partial [Brassica rapa subsp. narinosa]
STGAIDSSQFQAYLDKIRENYIRLMEDNSRDKMDPAEREEEEEESFSSSSDSDEEMNNSLEEVKRLMENMISTLKSKEEEFINTNSGDAVKIDDSKAEEMIIADDEENMFPRTRGRLVRYLGRHKSKPQDSSFQIEFHHLQLPSDDE